MGRDAESPPGTFLFSQYLRMFVPGLGVVQSNLNSNCDFSEADVQTSKPIQTWGKSVSPDQMHSTVSLLATLKYKLPFLEVVS